MRKRRRHWATRLACTLVPTSLLLVVGAEKLSRHRARAWFESLPVSHLSTLGVDVGDECFDGDAFMRECSDPGDNGTPCLDLLVERFVDHEVSPRERLNAGIDAAVSLNGLETSAIWSPIFEVLREHASYFSAADLRIIARRLSLARERSPWSQRLACEFVSAVALGEGWSGKRACDDSFEESLHGLYLAVVAEKNGAPPLREDSIFRSEFGRHLSPARCREFDHRVNISRAQRAADTGAAQMSVMLAALSEVQERGCGALPLSLPASILGRVHQVETFEESGALGFRWIQEVPLDPAPFVLIERACENQQGTE